MNEANKEQTETSITIIERKLGEVYSLAISIRDKTEKLSPQVTRVSKDAKAADIECVPVRIIDMLDETLSILKNALAGLSEFI